MRRRRAAFFVSVPDMLGYLVVRKLISGESSDEYEKK